MFRLEHHRRLPAHRPSRTRRIEHRKFRRRHARRHAALLRQHLVERHAAGLGIAARIRYAQLLQARLRLTVLAVSPVQREEHDIRPRCECPRVILRIEFVNRVPERLQRLHRRRARLQRHFALCGKPAEHHGDV